MFSQDLRNLQETLNGFKTLSRLIRMGSIKTEDVAGGRIAYFDFISDCSEYVHRESTQARLVGMIKTDRIFGTINVEGPMKADQIKTMAIDAIGKLVKTGFASAGK